jgi:hypothetical protein
MGSDIVVGTRRLRPISSGKRNIDYHFLDIRPLLIFERRLPSKKCTKFNTGMEKELLINTTISALSLNKRFDVVNGTELRTFNIYRFRNKLAFFLPYGITIGLAVPIITLGLAEFHIQI